MRWTIPLLLPLAAACTQPLPAETEQRFMPHSSAVLDLEEGTYEHDPVEFQAPYQPLRSPADRPDVTVYGFWPHWGDPLATLPWDQLTDVALFSVTMNSDGSLADEHYWTDHVDEALDLADPYGVSIHLTVTSFSDSVMDSVLGNSSRRATAVANLARLVNDAGAHGVNIDFEGMDPHLSDELVLFTEALRAEVGEVTLATPAADWNGSYDYAALAAASDGLFIMGYDYSWSGGDPGPVAPLDGSAYGIIDLQWTLDDYLGEGAGADDLIMGLPLYGRGWNTTSTTVPGTSTGGSWSEVYTASRQTGIDHGRHYDGDAEVAYAFPSSTSQVFYDDVTSLSAKIQWALAEGVSGVGFWALTYDDTDPVLWAEIDRHTHDTTASSTVPVAQPPTPGEADTDNTIVVTAVPPGHTVHLLLAEGAGVYDVPGCSLQVDLDAPELLGSADADADGEAGFTFPVDLADADRDLLVTAVDVTGCEASLPMIVRFTDPTAPEPTEPTEEPEPDAAEVCYPGEAGAYDVCAELTPAGTQGSAYDYPTSTSANYAAPTHLLELSRIPGDTMVAANFSRDELAQEWKGTFGVVQVHAVERLQDLRDQLGALVVTSGYRNPDYNASVGGATFSRHMYGDAFDLQPLSTSLSALGDACEDHGAGFVSVYTSHVHCDWRDDTQEPAFFGPLAPLPSLPGGDGGGAGLAMPHRAELVEGRHGELLAPAEGFDCGEPLREWVAYDAAGAVVGEATGAAYTPPADAVEVQVTVGRVVTVRRDLR